MPKKDYSQYTDYENYTMLTARELEVLKMKNSGSSNGEIAEIIGVKYNTVSIYLTQATQKIDGIYDHEKMRERKKVYARRRQEDPEYRNKRKEYDREYYHKNLEKSRQRGRENQKKHRDCRKEYQKEYQREYYRKNRDKIKNSQKEYYRKKREEVNESQRNAFRFSKANITAESILAEHGKGKAIRQIADERGCSRANIYQILNHYKKRMLESNPGSEIIGKKFGKLTVIKPDLSAPKGRSKWICQCECGNTTSVYRSHLISGQTTSCGCARKGVNLKDITGKRFGRLTAIERTETKSGNAYIYKCLCDCGNICYVSGDHLRKGDTVSCGCYASDIHRESFSSARTKRSESYVDGTDLMRISKDKPQSNNTSGHIGVSWDGSVGVWKARITFKGKRYYLGSSHDINDAIELRKAAEKELFGNFLEWYNNLIQESGGTDEKI